MKEKQQKSDARQRFRNQDFGEQGRLWTGRVTYVRALGTVLRTNRPLC